MPDALAELAGLTGPHPDWFRRALGVPRESAEVVVDGCPIRYLRWGDPSKPGVVFVHGFLAHSRCFAFIAPFLARDHQVVAYDVSGYGDSGHRQDYAETIRARELLAVAEHAGMQHAPAPPTIVAHSYGATIAMDTIEQLGDHFGGLVVCDVLMLRPDRLRAFRARASISAEPRSESPPRRIYPDLAAAMQRFRLAPPQPVEQPFLLEYVARHSLAPYEGAWSWKFHPSSFLVDSHGNDWWIEQPKRFVALDHRKAIVYGENSQLFDADTETYLGELGATHVPMVAIPDARHHLMLDQPLAFASTLRALLASWASAEAPNALRG